MKSLLSLVGLVLLVQCGVAQTTADYLKLRTEQHIVQPTPGQRLDTIVGNSIVEIQGTVQGYSKDGSSTQLMVLRDDKQTMLVQCAGNPPEWLNNGEVPVRILARIYHSGVYEPIIATLMSVAREEDISKVDEAYWRSEAEKAKAQKQQAQSRKSYSSASRGGDEMYGWIGRGHRHTEYSSDGILSAYRNFILDRNRNLSPKVADEIARSVIAYSNHYGVDARLVMAVIICESDFHPMSTSHSGAMGLGQLMPGTATWMGVHNPYDLRDNIYGTIKLLATHLEEYHVRDYPFRSDSYFRALELVLAAYNAGDGAVRRHGGVPPYRETQAYVGKVLAYFQGLIRED